MLLVSQLASQSTHHSSRPTATPKNVRDVEAPAHPPETPPALDSIFPALEALAEDIGQTFNPLQGEDFDTALRAACPFKIDVLPAAIMGHTLRRYDLHRRRLLLHRALPWHQSGFRYCCK